MLKSDEIARLLKEGAEPGNPDPLVITPFLDLEKLENEGSSSVDLRLGTWFVGLKNAKLTHLGIGQFGYDEQLTNAEFVRFGRNYVLHPGGFVLSITMEWLRLPGDLAAYVIGKSSWGRRGLIIATATSVHPGFKGCLTLELSNVGELPIEISPGSKICQICLHTVKTRIPSLSDKSQFVGSRKPAIGEINLDESAKLLAEAYEIAPNTQNSNSNDKDS